MTLQQRAAEALDATHAKTNRGLLTLQARDTLAAYLDGAAKLKASYARKLCSYLEMVARS